MIIIMFFFFFFFFFFFYILLPPTKLLPVDYYLLGNKKFLKTFNFIQAKSEKPPEGRLTCFSILTTKRISSFHQVHLPSFFPFPFPFFDILFTQRLHLIAILSSLSAHFIDLITKEY